MNAVNCQAECIRLEDELATASIDYGNLQKVCTALEVENENLHAVLQKAACCHIAKEQIPAKNKENKVLLIVLKIIFWICFLIIASASIAIAGYVATAAGMRAPWNWLILTMVMTGLAIIYLEESK